MENDTLLSDGFAPEGLVERMAFNAAGAFSTLFEALDDDQLPFLTAKIHAENIRFPPVPGNANGFNRELRDP